MTETREQRAMWAATVAARKILTQAKNPRTLLHTYSATMVAYHAAWAAIDAHRASLDSTATIPKRQETL